MHRHAERKAKREHTVWWTTLPRRAALGHHVHKGVNVGTAPDAVVLQTVAALQVLVRRLHGNQQVGTLLQLHGRRPRVRCLERHRHRLIIAVGGRNRARQLHATLRQRPVVTATSEHALAPVLLVSVVAELHRRRAVAHRDRLRRIQGARMSVGRTAQVYLHGRRRDGRHAREAKREDGYEIVGAAVVLNTTQGRWTRARFARLALDKHLQDLDKDNVKPAIEDFGEALDGTLRVHKDRAHVGHAEG